MESEKLFLEELNALPTLDASELTALAKTGFGQPEAIEKLANGYQQKLYELAGDYVNEAASRMDILMEGNIAMLECASNFSGDPENFPAALETAVKKAMNAFRKEEEQNKKTNELLRDKLNLLDEITVRFAEKNGRAPSSKELADLLLTDEEEIEYLTKIALSVLNSDGEEEEES